MYSTLNSCTGCGCNYGELLSILIIKMYEFSIILHGSSMWIEDCSSNMNNVKSILVLALCLHIGLSKLLSLFQLPTAIKFFGISRY